MNQDITTRKRKLQEDIEIAKRELKDNFDNIEPLRYIKPDFSFVNKAISSIVNLTKAKKS